MAGEILNTVLCWLIPVKVNGELDMCTRAVQLIEFDSHAHLVSKAGSVIGTKSPFTVH